MKILKYMFIWIISLVIIVLVTRKILITREYNKQLSIGNEYAHNIITYLQKHKKMPDEWDRETLRQLNPNPEGEYLEARAAWPMYKQINSRHFTLTFLEGFDWPHLTYDSATETWEMK